MRSSYRVSGRPSCSLGCPCGSTGKEFACNVRHLGSIPRLGRSPGEGKGYPLVFWPGEFHGLYSPWGRKESDTTEQIYTDLVMLSKSPPSPT